MCFLYSASYNTVLPDSTLGPSNRLVSEPLMDAVFDVEVCSELLLLRTGAQHGFVGERQRVFLPFRTTVSCEFVCKAWRSLLRSRSAPGTYGREVGLSVPSSEHIYGGRYCLTLVVPSTAAQSYALGGWFSQRPGGFKRLTLHLGSGRSYEIECLLHFLEGLDNSLDIELRIDELGPGRSGPFDATSI